MATNEWTHSYLKPLSVNEAWRGKKLKTDTYKRYESQLIRNLPDIEIPDGDLELRVVVYYSSRASDVDNCLKPFIDVLQKRYQFNDNRIYRIRITKVIVKKGDENLAFKLLPFTPSKVPLAERIRDFWHRLTCPNCSHEWHQEIKGDLHGDHEESNS